METAQEKTHKLKAFPVSSRFNILIIMVVLSLVLGSTSGFFLANKQTSQTGLTGPATEEAPKTAAQDNRLCRDCAEGTIKVKPAPKDPNEYTEGTHLLERDSGYPVALTSSVIDLSE